MREQFEVIYENGVFRPLVEVSGQFQEHQRFTVTIEELHLQHDWLAAADATASLEEVRRILNQAPSSLARMLHSEREER
jgi:predicted DNA-binding antitoxin AbrB/MazE fold protein